MGSGGLTANGGTLDLAGVSPSVTSLKGALGVITNSTTSESILTINQAGSTTFGGSSATRIRASDLPWAAARWS